MKRFEPLFHILYVLKRCWNLDVNLLRNALAMINSSILFPVAKGYQVIDFSICIDYINSSNSIEMQTTFDHLDASTAKNNPCYGYALC